MHLRETINGLTNNDEGSEIQDSLKRQKTQRRTTPNLLPNALGVNFLL